MTTATAARPVKHSVRSARSVALAHIIAEGKVATLDGRDGLLSAMRRRGWTRGDVYGALDALSSTGCIRLQPLPHGGIAVMWRGGAL